MPSTRVGQLRSKKKNVEDTVLSDHEVIERAPGGSILKPAELAAEPAKAAASAVFQLPPEQQKVVLLKVIQGLTMREISSITGVTLGTVNDRLTRGLQALAACLKGRGAL